MVFTNARKITIKTAVPNSSFISVLTPFNDGFTNNAVRGTYLLSFFVVDLNYILS